MELARAPVISYSTVYRVVPTCIRLLLPANSPVAIASFTESPALTPKAISSSANKMSVTATEDMSRLKESASPATKSVWKLFSSAGVVTDGAATSKMPGIAAVGHAPPQSSLSVQ